MPSISDIVANGRKSLASLLGGRSLWGLADQLLVSFTNFATMILVARGLHDAGKFGVFTLVYSAMLFANILQFALVTQPHNVLGQTRSGDDYRVYTATTGLIATLPGADARIHRRVCCIRRASPRFAVHVAIDRPGSVDRLLADPGIRAPRDVHRASPGRRVRQ